MTPQHIALRHVGLEAGLITPSLEPCYVDPDMNQYATLKPAGTGTALLEPGFSLSDSLLHVHRAGGEWYFTSRFGDIGPFRTREQAYQEAAAHARVC